jgi:hypothetical protein
VLRVMVEAPTEEECEKYAALVVEKLKAQGHAIA